MDVMGALRATCYRALAVARMWRTSGEVVHPVNSSFGDFTLCMGGVCANSISGCSARSLVDRLCID